MLDFSIFVIRVEPCLMRLLLLKNTYLEVERPSEKLLGERGVQTARVG